MDRVEHKVVNVSLTSLEESVLYCSERQTDSLVRTFRDPDLGSNPMTYPICKIPYIFNTLII